MTLLCLFVVMWPALSPPVSCRYGLMVLAVQWVKGYGPSNSFTLHGLWPDKCNGADVTNCRSSGVSSVQSVVKGNATLLSRLNTYWPSYNGPSTNAKFWNDEWTKHGTCFTPVDPTCYTPSNASKGVLDYFTLAVGLVQQYDIYSALSAAGYTPSSTTKISAANITKAVQTRYPNMGVQVVCSDSRVYFELRLFFKVQGKSTFVPAPAQGGGGGCSTVSYGKK